MFPSPRQRGIAWFVLVAGLAAWPAHATDLATLLRAVEANATFEVPAMARLTIEASGAASTTIQLYGRGGVVRLEAASGWRALAKTSKVVVAAPGQPPRAVPDAEVAGSKLLAADFAPFTADALRVPQISDDGPLGVVVTGEPRPPSPYVLQSLTIEPERAVVRAVKYYRWEINNLVQMSRVREWVTVAERVRPRLIDVQDLAGGKTTTLTFEWEARPDLAAGLFTPAGLRQAVPAVGGGS